MHVAILIIVLHQLFTQRCVAFSLPSAPTADTHTFVGTVTNWLDDEGVSWRFFHLPEEFGLDQDPVEQPAEPNQVLEIWALENQNGTSSCLLHTVPTPQQKRDYSDSSSPQFHKRLTDYFAMSNGTVVGAPGNEVCQVPTKIIHLHQDVWSSKNEIVRSRLLAQAGRFQRRIFARTTLSRRINATAAMDFLNENHLWGATRAKYYYGLFTKQDGELVAVATFSSRRKIERNGRIHRSHELLRFCTRRATTVVGGISKLTRLFVNEQSPDDIVTVVDRDWGTGSGWHSLGFQTVATMDPIVMVINPKEQQRRHLVGAGIIHKPKNEHTVSNAATNNGDNDRLGLPTEVIQELQSCQSAEGALDILASHSFYPVYDSGVERLMKVVSDSSHNNDDPSTELSATELWRKSTPRYASSYYSDVSGIAALLRHAEFDCTPVLDSKNHAAIAQSWRSTSGTANDARLVFSAPSSLDPNATVEVRERDNGWRTVGVVGGAVKSIYHAVYKVDAKGVVDPTAVVSETYKTMAALALTTLSRRPTDSRRTTRFLHIGFGAGTLVRFLAHQVTDSQHIAVELDRGVVAATEHYIAADSNTQIIVGDASTYHRPANQEPFDCITIDVFDDKNLQPEAFYSTAFLEHMRDNLLGPLGAVVHNFHSGGKKRSCQIDEATVAYRNTFPVLGLVDSLDSRSNAGNSIFLASKMAVASDEATDRLNRAGWDAKKKWDTDFDVQARVKGMTILRTS